MFKISEAEREFLIGGINSNCRNDGRNRLDFRPFKVKTGILNQTNGSSRVLLSNTDVLVGIKCEVGDPDPHFPSQGRIHVSVECCPSASPEFEGRGAESLNNELTLVIERIVKDNSALDLSQLCILSGKVVWNVYIDVMVLNSGGNLFDAISLATRSALENTDIPKVEVNEEAEEFDVSDDPDDFTKLNVENVPISVTFTKIGNGYVVDSTIEEELCMSARLTVAVNKRGNICTIQKGGPGGFEPSAMAEMITNARRLSQDLIRRLESELSFERAKGTRKDQSRFRLFE
eukprot:TRINITY_DN3275_c0_g1_i2.p1 TRINITY_DN3275_c0_g1~~TRINITY_DN3275_c0_g1_i2.p1  ORF type:complete len:289 (+),score=117.75 TRINITY_DN3275_c0_g1_i2:201-1067(+)